jgi:hypothetical protein
MEVKEIRVPSFGEQLIGINIDDENTDEVSDNKHPLKSLLFDHAVGEIVNAQMTVVKVLTLKHYTEDEA